MAWEHTKLWSCQVKGHEDQIFKEPDVLADYIHQEHAQEIPADQILLEAQSQLPTHLPRWL